MANGPVIEWRGVPYAAPPVGDLRFRPPEPARPWAGVRDATRFGAAAAQAFSPLQALVGGVPGEASEDCLFLNIFAPAAAGAGRPVMVWIHGGAFVGGSGSSRWYDGSRFAAHDEVIVVTFNYRLGSLGFLDLGQACPGSANCGLLDQLAALRWVQDNIAVFGGDPDQVTVFGESAGAMSIGLMLTMPLARGLFQRAILASGTGASTRSAEQARQVTADVLAAFGGTVDELLVAPVEQILAAQTAVTGGSDATGYMCFRPVVDGDIIPAPADEAIAAGQSADIPVLIGTNRDEMTMFFAFDPTIAALTPEQFDAEAAAQIGPARWARMAQHYRDHCPPATRRQSWPRCRPIWSSGCRRCNSPTARPPRDARPRCGCTGWTGPVRPWADASGPSMPSTFPSCGL